MTNKLSYMNKVCTGKVRFRDSFDILFYFLRSGPSAHFLREKPWGRGWLPTRYFAWPR